MNNDMFEAIKKRNRDMWWRLNGHGVWSWFDKPWDADRVFKGCAEDIDLLLDEIQRLKGELGA